MSKNSPKRPGDRLPSDGGVSPFDSSPDISGGGGGAGTAEAEPNSIAFALERIVLALLPQLKPGQAVEFAEQAENTIAATWKGKTVGFVPRAFIKAIKEAIARGGYTAMIEDVSHEAVRVRVTG